MARNSKYGREFDLEVKELKADIREYNELCWILGFSKIPRHVLINLILMFAFLIGVALIVIGTIGVIV
jgi:hypothetical protein